MVAIKNRDADAFVARPSPAQPIVLLYGPDAGLVHERAEKIIGASVDDTNDPFALVRIDGEADLIRLVDDEMRQAKLAIAPDARAALVSLIGGDRQASRGEIRKLALYAHGQERVVLDDVLAVVADASAMALDAVIDAAFAGKTAELETQFSKALGAGTAPGTIMSGTLRYVAQLHKARLALDSGDSTDEALRAFIPPVHFSRRSSVEGALRNWTSPRLARAMEQLAETALNVRRTPALAEALA